MAETEAEKIQRLCKNFALKEFVCHCCNISHMDEELLSTLQLLRNSIKFPLHINSGYRCEPYNKRIGGKIDSMHLIGKAVDISTPTIPSDMIHNFMFMCHALFNGIGIAANFIHIDVRSKDQKAFWTYP